MIIPWTPPVFLAAVRFAGLRVLARSSSGHRMQLHDHHQRSGPCRTIGASRGQPGEICPPSRPTCRLSVLTVSPATNSASTASLNARSCVRVFLSPLIQSSYAKDCHSFSVSLQGCIPPYSLLIRRAVTFNCRSIRLRASRRSSSVRAFSLSLLRHLTKDI